MVTKSMASTPFGMKLIYKINGECIWSEYLSGSPTPKVARALSIRQRAGNVLDHLKRGVRSALLMRAS